MEVLEEFKKTVPQYLADETLSKIPGSETIIETVISWLIEQKRIEGAPRQLIINTIYNNIPRTNPLRLALISLTFWGFSYTEAREKCVHFIRVFLRYHKFKNREHKN